VDILCISIAELLLKFYVKIKILYRFELEILQCKKSHIFSTIILNKNTHKIIILGIYIFG
jgi:hypothetical protein